jgi:hypothetical protein
MAIGSDLTFYSKPSILDRLYGNNPVSWRLFLRLRPAKMDMSSMHGMHGNLKMPEEKTPTKPQKEEVGVASSQRRIGTLANSQTSHC